MPPFPHPLRPVFVPGGAQKTRCHGLRPGDGDPSSRVHVAPWTSRGFAGRAFSPHRKTSKRKRIQTGAHTPCRSKRPRFKPVLELGSFDNLLYSGKSFSFASFQPNSQCIFQNSQPVTKNHLPHLKALSISGPPSVDWSALSFWSFTRAVARGGVASSSRGCDVTKDTEPAPPPHPHPHTDQPNVSG